MLKTKPNEIANQPQAPHETSAAVRAPRRGLWQEWLRSLLLFCGVQGLYLLRISRANGGRTLWGARLVLCLLSPALLAVLGRLTGENLLALIYFSNFLCNVALAVRLPRGWGRQFALGLTLFLCCDVCVGIFQSPGLLPPALEAFASLGMWLFYLPGQVLIVLSGRDPHEMRSFHENQ